MVIYYLVVNFDNLLDSERNDDVYIFYFLLKFVQSYILDRNNLVGTITKNEVYF